MRRATLLAGAATLATGLFLAPLAEATPMTVNAPQQLSATPITISLGSATFAFTLDNTTFAPASAVATGGSGAVTTIFGGIADFGAGSTINNDPSNLLYSFASYASPTTIPNSQADDYIGFSYTGVGGTHYGYAEVFGGNFVGYGYETAANTAITTAPVPEPASVALLLVGLTAIGVARFGRRAARSDAIA